MNTTYKHTKEFEGVDFSKKVPAKEYENCRFNNCNFEYSNLSSVKFIDCEFNDCNFSRTKISATLFRDVKFKNCKLLGLLFEDCDKLLLSMNFEDCQLNLASFY